MKASLRFQNVELSGWLSELPSITPWACPLYCPNLRTARLPGKMTGKFLNPALKETWPKKVEIGLATGLSAQLHTLSLRQWLQPAEQALQQDHTLVVFADDLDALGENVSELSITAFYQSADSRSLKVCEKLLMQVIKRACGHRSWLLVARPGGRLWQNRAGAAGA